MNSLYARLSILQFLQFFIWGSWFVTAGTYFLETLRFSGREIGLIYGTNSIAATVSPFLVGILADRFFAVEKLLFVLHIVGAGLLFGLSYITDFSWFYPVVLLYVLCYLPTFSLTNSLCFHHVADAQNDFPRVRVWGTVSWILAGLLIGWLGVENQVLPFRIAAACSLVQGFYSLTLPHTPPQPQQESFLQSLRGPEIRQLLQDYSFVILIGAVALICIPIAYYYSFTNPFLNEIGMENAAGKMSLGQITEIVLMLAVPWLMQNWRLKTIIFLGLLAWGVRYGLYIVGIQTGLEFWLLIAIALHGLAYIFSMLTTQIYLDTRIPNHLRSTGQGFFSLLTLGFFMLIGSIIAGESVHYFARPDGTHDWQWIWALPTVVGILTAILFWALFREKKTS